MATHGLAGAHEERMAHAGFSGSHLSRLRRGDGASFVLKRMSIERDWIMRATDDVGCREVQFAAAAPRLPQLVRVPSVGYARDGDEFALLMSDITNELVPPAASPISVAELDHIVSAMAQLHSTAPPAAVGWCGLRERLTLLTPVSARIAEAYGAPVARDIMDGWWLFERHAPAAAISLVSRLFTDPGVLLDALDKLPPALLHGDLKLDNIGLDEEGAMWLIDWAMTLVAPPAVELGWFLAINSRRLPVSLDDVMARYAAVSGMPAAVRERHDAFTVLCGLLLRGWRKALDAESGEPAELRWWCDRAVAAASCL